MSQQPSIEERLTALELASAERQEELRGTLEKIPAALSRRSLLVDAANDLRSAPNKADIARRGVRKLLRAPKALYRRATASR